MNRLIILCFLILISCNNEIKQGGTIVTKTLNSIEFKGVSINDGIQLTLSQDTSHFEISADENIISHVLYFVKDDILNIYLDPTEEYPKSVLVKVKASNPELNYINAHDGAYVSVPDTIISKNFQMHVSDKAEINCDSLVVSNQLYIRVDATSVLNIAGEVNKALLTISDNSRVNARDLAIDTADIVVYSGSEVTLWVKDSLAVDISRASKVRYFGEDKMKLSKKVGEDSKLIKLQ